MEVEKLQIARCGSRVYRTFTLLLLQTWVNREQEHMNYKIHRLTNRMWLILTRCNHQLIQYNRKASTSIHQAKINYQRIDNLDFNQIVFGINQCIRLLINHTIWLLTNCSSHTQLLYLIINDRWCLTNLMEKRKISGSRN